MPDPWSTSSMMWTAVFSIILIISIIGNCGVLWIILGMIIHYSIKITQQLLNSPDLSAHRAMWTVTNYFLLSLTISDLLISTINCIPSFIFMRDRVWLYGGLYCKINNFVSYMTVSSSVFTLLAISNDRDSESEVAASNYIYNFTILCLNVIFFYKP